MTLRFGLPALAESRARRRSGQSLIVALVILLYVTTLLGTMSLGLMAEAELATDQSRRLAAYYTARAGCEAAFRELLFDNPEIDTLADRWSRNSFRFGRVSLGEGWYEVRYRPAPGEPFVPGVLDEERKLNINKASAAMLARLDGLLAEQTVEALVARREQQPFRSLAETADAGILGWSEVEPEGLLASLLTVHGDGRVNVNTAARAVLACLPGVSGEQAAAFVEWRDERPEERFAATPEDAAERLGVAQGEREEFLRRAKVASTYFTITSVGRLAGAVPRTREIRMTVRREVDKLEVVAFEELR